MTNYLDFVSYSLHCIILFYYFILIQHFVFDQNMSSVSALQIWEYSELWLKRKKTHIWKSIICWNFIISAILWKLPNPLTFKLLACHKYWEQMGRVGWKWNASQHKQSSTCFFCSLVLLEDASLLTRAFPKSWEIRAVKGEFFLTMCSVCSLLYCTKAKSEE